MDVTWIERLGSWWVNFRGHRRLLGILLLLLCVAVAVVGVPRLRIFGHDIFVSLDGGWRVLNGQRPAVDFYAQMGPAYYLLHAAGLRLAGNDARGLGYGSVLATGAISLWCYFTLRRRMAPAPFFVACLFFALLAAAPFPLGFPPTHTAFCMKHNRYGYALTGLVLLEAFLPAGKDGKERFWGGFSTGAACALLLFVKISFGFVAMAFAGWGWLVRPNRKMAAAGLAAGFVAIGLPMTYLRFDLGALVTEYQLLAGVKAGSLCLYDVLNRIYVDRHEIMPVLVMSLLVAMLPSVRWYRGLTLVVVAILATATGNLLLLTNTQPWGLPLLSAVALLLVNEVTISTPKGAAPLYVIPMVAIGLIGVFFSMVLDAGGIAYAIADKASSDTSGYRLEAAHLASIEFIDCREKTLNAWCSMNDNGQNFVRYTEEGRALVARNARPGESVRGMGMSNPLSYGTLSPPSKGGSVVLCGTNVSANAMPPKKALVGDVALILLPKFPATDRATLQLILHSYPELLTVDYSVIAESPNWVLYRRNSAT
jgi:hypothetical protein